MPATKELVASKKTDEEIGAEIGADWLIYQDLSDLIASVQVGNPAIKEFECSVFTGEYITPLSEGYLENLENTRDDSSKVTRLKAN
jgi:amidophosphoribosyltransferase